MGIDNTRVRNCSFEEHSEEIFSPFIFDDRVFAGNIRVRVQEVVEGVKTVIILARLNELGGYLADAGVYEIHSI